MRLFRAEQFAVRLRDGIISPYSCEKRAIVVQVLPLSCGAGVRPRPCPRRQFDQRPARKPTRREEVGNASVDILFFVTRRGLEAHRLHLYLNVGREGGPSVDQPLEPCVRRRRIATRGATFALTVYGHRALTLSLTRCQFRRCFQTDTHSIPAASTDSRPTHRAIHWDLKRQNASHRRGFGGCGLHVPKDRLGSLSIH